MKAKSTILVAIATFGAALNGAAAEGDVYGRYAPASRLERVEQWDPRRFPTEQQWHEYRERKAHEWRRYEPERYDPRIEQGHRPDDRRPNGMTVDAGR